MPCSAHKRNTDAARPWGMAGVASAGSAYGFAYSRKSDLRTPLAARPITTLTPETLITARRDRRLRGTTPIPVVTANGRPQVRNKEGSCGNGQY